MFNKISLITISCIFQGPRYLLEKVKRFRVRERHSFLHKLLHTYTILTSLSRAAHSSHNSSNPLAQTNPITVANIEEFFGPQDYGLLIQLDKAVQLRLVF